ncbi:MAG: Bifunctional transcriptional activator/DNA repair enzyme Ada [Pseudomonadota bacterium]|jgi:AraC family transcriptional regulator of adaptative response/methylated-DNA-[protein]-cysteine methyltransferase
MLTEPAASSHNRHLQPMQLHAPQHDKITRAIGYIVEHFDEQPDLAQLARVADLSETHFQRVFTEWAGVSPKRFVEVVTRNHARGLLAAGASTLDATYESGLSSPSRLQDLFVKLDGLTPSQVRGLGAGMTLTWGCFQSLLGATAAAWTGQGICALVFADAAHPREFEAMLAAQWPGAVLKRDDVAIAARIAPVVCGDHALPLHVRGTNFQIQVWQALLAIEPGRVTTYGNLAHLIGKPKAARAVGTAVGSNPVSVLIPCHRVIRESGALGGYAWGLSRKITLLGREWSGAAVRQSQDVAAAV